MSNGSASQPKSAYPTHDVAKTGRPCKIDDLTAQRLIKAVAKGLPRDTAAKLASISPATFYRALRLGREGDPDFLEFAKRIKEAEAKGEQELVDLIRGHGKASWQACAWLLERRRPERWGPRKAALADGGGRPVTPATTEEQISQVESVLAALRSS